MGKPPSKAPSKGMASTWTLVAVLCLVGLVVTSGLALYFGIYANPIGTYSSYVAYALIVALVVLAAMGKKLQHHVVTIPQKKPRVTKKAVSTGAGSIQMASD